MTTQKSISGRRFFCSWSGGKDSCLALYHALRDGGELQGLFTMLSEDGVTSRSHALPKSLLERQAASLGTRAFFGSASWRDYETAFVDALRGFKASGIDAGVFGDIDLEPHREWVLRVCDAAGVEAFHPLWKRNRRELLEEFIGLGFDARIIVVNEEKMDQRFLGKTIRPDTVLEMEEAGIDPSGELGEYHTVVTDGPLFSAKIDLGEPERLYHEGYWFLKSSE